MKLLVKPSFSLQALVWFIWTWPPKAAVKPVFMHTADITNPYIRQQFARSPGFGTRIFTSDLFWRRFNRTKENPKPYLQTSREWQAIQQEWNDFLWEENEFPVVLLIGELNITRFPKGRKNLVSVRIPGPSIYKESPRLWLMLDESQTSIQRIVIPSYHTEMDFRNLTREHAAQMDWAWNLVAVLGHLP